MKYESSILNGLKVMTEVKVFVHNADADTRAMTLALRTFVPARKKLWYHVKGLVPRNTHLQYESPITSGKKVIAKVKVF